MLIDCVQLSPLITEEDSYDLVDKILDLGTVYSKENLEKNVRKRTDINKPESSVFQNVEIINKAISQNKKIRFRFVYPTQEKIDESVRKLMKVDALDHFALCCPILRRDDLL